MRYYTNNECFYSCNGKNIFMRWRMECSTAITVREAFWRMWFIEKQKECNSKKRIVLLHSGECNSILLLHSWEIELSIRHHVTKINQLNDLNLTRYYIIEFFLRMTTEEKTKFAGTRIVYTYLCISKVIN